MAVLVEAVERARGVVDQFDQPVPTAGFVDVGQQLRQFGRRHHAALRQFGRLATDRFCFAEDRAGGFAGRAQALQRRPWSLPRTGSGSGSRRSARERLCRGRRRPGWPRRRSPAGCASSAGTRAGRWAVSAATLPARRRVRSSPGRRRRRWRGSRRRGRARARAARGSASRVAGQLGELVALVGEDAEQGVDVAQDRVGPLDQDLEVLAAPGQAGAEFVEDQPEALRVGQRLDVVDQVRVDAGAAAAERQQVLAFARLAVGDLLQRRRRLACPAPAAGSGGSRRTSRRSATAGGSGRWRRCGSPGSRGRSISITMIALPGLSTGLPSSVGHRSRPACVTPTDSIVPTLAPATRTCSPSTMKPPLSKTARIL